MKKPIIIWACFLIALSSNSQVGIGTTSPNTTLDVRGSLAVNTRSFSATSETVSATDYTLLFTGTSACTVTLPTAVGCTGRIIHIKNTKTTSVPVLTVSTTSSQTIDGSGTTWLLDDPNESVNLVSDGSNWKVMGHSLPWSQGGNTVASVKKLGTIDAYDLSFITSNTERMRLSNSGGLFIGNTASAGNYSIPNDEILYVDGGTSNSPNNLVTLTGNVNGYMQLNIQNENNGNFASSDIVATANNGNSDPNDNTYYIDMGINSLGYITGNSNILNGANSAYLYSNATEFYVGNGAPNYPLIFFTNGSSGSYGNNTANGTERMRIAANGNIAIGTTSTTTYKLNVSGGVNASGGYTSVSDERLKTNINHLKYGLSQVLALRPVSYNWKDTSQKANQIGFIAQEVKMVIPEVVTGDEKEEIIGIKYSELVPVLVNAIKEQQQQIEELKKRISTLENK